MTKYIVIKRVNLIEECVFKVWFIRGQGPEELKEEHTQVLLPRAPTYFTMTKLSSQDLLSLYTKVCSELTT